MRPNPIEENGLLAQMMTRVRDLLSAAPGPVTAAVAQQIFFDTEPNDTPETGEILNRS
jgi:hypothetical protein